MYIYLGAHSHAHVITLMFFCCPSARKEPSDGEQMEPSYLQEFLLNLRRDLVHTSSTSCSNSERAGPPLPPKTKKRKRWGVGSKDRVILFLNLTGPFSTADSTDCRFHRERHAARRRAARGSGCCCNWVGGEVCQQLRARSFENSETCV